MRRAAMVCVLGILVLHGCGRRIYRKRTTVWMPSNEQLTVKRLERRYQMQDIDGVLDTLDRRRFAQYVQVRDCLIRRFRTTAKVDVTLEIHDCRRDGDRVDFTVHWRRTVYDVWKRRYVPDRGLTHFVVSSQTPWRIVDVYGDRFF